MATALEHIWHVGTTVKIVDTDIILGDSDGDRILAIENA